MTAVTTAAVAASCDGWQSSVTRAGGQRGVVIAMLPVKRRDALFNEASRPAQVRLIQFTDVSLLDWVRPHRPCSRCSHCCSRQRAASFQTSSIVSIYVRSSRTQRPYRSTAAVAREYMTTMKTSSWCSCKT